MSLKKRISLFFLLAAAIVIVTLYAASHLFILNSFTKLEEENETDDMKRVLLAVKEMETALVDRLNDYAASSTVQAALSGSDTDLASYFSDRAFLNNRFTSILLLDENNQVIFQKKMNFKTAVSQLNAPDLLSFTQTEPELIASDTFSEIYYTGGNAMIVAARPIESAEGSSGTLLLERAFDPLAIRDLRAETQLPIKFNSITNTAVPKDAAGSQNGSLIHSPIWIKRNGEEIHTVYTSIHDFKDEPALIIGFNAPRDIYLQGRQTMFLWLLFTVCVAVFLISIGIYLLNRLVFSRLTVFVQSISDIRGRINFALRLPVKGHDEISKLEREFNRLLDTIEQSRTQIMKLAYEDTLTRLTNRAYFYKEANRQLTVHETDGTTASIMFLDLDGFKQVNDRYGHETGDALLRHVAKLLRGSLRGSDIVSRLGGDEFIVFLADVQEIHEAAVIAARICEAISKPIIVNGCTVNVSASIGISFYPAHGTDLDTLITNADKAMFDAKHLGKNQYAFYKELVKMT